MSAHTTAAGKSIGVGGRIGATAAVVVLLAAGTFVIGRAADDQGLAMSLTAAWFAVVATGAYALSRSRRQLRAPMAGGVVATAIAVGVVLGLPTVTDDTVDETVVTGARPGEDPDPAAGGEAPATGEDAAPADRNVTVAEGSFVPLAHPGSGTASVVELASGERRLTLTDFATDNGPDLFVYLAADAASDGSVEDFVDLGRLKGNEGDQEYAIPGDVDLERYSNVVIWCRAFTVGFTEAPLEPTS